MSPSRRRNSEYAYDPLNDTWTLVGFEKYKHKSKKAFQKVVDRVHESTSPLLKNSVRGSLRNFGETVQSLDDELRDTSEEEKSSQALPKALKLSIGILLCVSAVIASACSFFIDEVIQQWVPNLRVWATSKVSSVPPFVVEVAISVVLIWIARLCVKFRPACAGSGIPEVKCMLSGERLRGYLTWSVALCKAFGLALASSAGLQIGKEGPFVHIATCVGSKLIDNFSYFQSLRTKKARETVMLTGVTIGVGTTFSAPISGVLLAMELMMPHMYSKLDFRSCFFGAIIGSLIFMILEMLGSGSGKLSPLLASDVKGESAESLWQELVFIGLCCLLGVICGYLGALFVQVQMWSARIVNHLRGAGRHEKIAILFRRIFPEKLLGCSSKVPILVKDFLILAAVSVINIFRIFGSTPLYALSLPRMIDELLFVNSSYEMSFFMYLELLIVKWIMVVVSLCMPVPAGCIAPVIAIGALIGRVYGCLIPEFLQLYLDPHGDFREYQARFAIIGASTFAAAVCHAMAMVVAVFELLAIPRIVIPLLASTWVSVRCAVTHSHSIFDAICINKKLPCLPTLGANGYSSKPVEDAAEIKNDRLAELTILRDASTQELKKLKANLQELPSLPESIAFVERVAKTQAHGELATYDYAYLGCMPRVKLDALIRYVEEGGSLVDEREDVFMLAIRKRLMSDTMLVEKGQSLHDVYLRCHAEYYDRTVMILDRGCLIGIFMMSDLFRNMK